MFETALVAQASSEWYPPVLHLVRLKYPIYCSIMAKTSAPQEQEKSSKRSKGKGKATKEPEAPKVDSPADNGFSLFKSASSKDAELDDLFSKSVRIRDRKMSAESLILPSPGNVRSPSSSETSRTGRSGKAHDNV